MQFGHAACVHRPFGVQTLWWWLQFPVHKVKTGPHLGLSLLPSILLFHTSIAVLQHLLLRQWFIVAPGLAFGRYVLVYRSHGMTVLK